jgi:hypothetical protein
MTALAIELDGVLGDTRPLWRDWLEDAARRYRSIAPLDPSALPEDRAAAAAELDRWAVSPRTGRPSISGRTRRSAPP